jgi:zinc protease
MFGRSIITLLAALLFSTTLLRAEEREITVTLTVPDAAWVIFINEVHEVKNEIWVISTVSRDPDMMGAQVISVVKASVKCAAADLPVKHFVIGKTWGWKYEEPYTFINNLKELERELKYGKLLYKSAEKKS